MSRRTVRRTHVQKPQSESGSAEIAGEMAREEAASKATASRGSGAEPYWSEALKSFLDHIPVSSVPGALQPTASPGIPRMIHSIYPITKQLSFCTHDAAVEVKLDGSILGALDAMYSSNAAGAVVVDVVQSSFGKYVDRDIGFVEFSSLVMWALEVTSYLTI